MSGKSILIVTASHLCRNPRVVKEATTLGLAGYAVTVLSVSTSERFERMDRDLIRGQPFKRVVLDYTAADVPARFRNFRQRATTRTARWLCRRGGIELAASLGPAGAILRRARELPADLIILHTEAPTWAARFLIADGRRVAVDLEDWYSEDLLEADRRSRPLRLLRRAEHDALHQAAYVSTTSDSMAAELAVRYACKPPLVIRNTFPLPSRSRLDQPITTSPPRFVWFSQTIGPGRGLELFFAAWSQMRHSSRVILIGDARPGYPQQLLEPIAPARRADVEFLPLVPPADLPAALCGYDVGLALEPHLPLNKFVTTSNKVFQYLAAGLAVVATDTAGQREVFRAAPDAGLIVAAHETAHFTAKLDALVSDPVTLRRRQSAARDAAVTRFCWERDSTTLLNAVKVALEKVS